MTSGHGPSAFDKNRFLQICAGIFLLSGTLTGCGLFGGDAGEENTGQPAEKADLKAVDDEELVVPVGDQIGTPMAERVATLGFLNKRNGQTRDLELKPGQSIQVGRAIVRLRACERTAPWELNPEQGAFVQLLVNDRPPTRRGEDKWVKVFSGWLFRESPSLNVVEHPIYDVWVKSCEMSFPGEAEAPEGVDATEPRSSSSNLGNNPSSAENEGGETSGTAGSGTVEPVPTTPRVAPVPTSPPAVRPVPETAPRAAPEAVETLDDLISANTGE